MTTPVDEPTLLLEERLCLALYTASRAMTATYRPLLAELGLTYPQYLVLVVLWEDGDRSVGQIGQRLSLESSTLSPLLKRLAAMGLIARTRDADDERSVIISLTTGGSAMRDRCAPIPGAVCLATGFEERQTAALVEELRQLVARLGSSAAS